MSDIEYSVITSDVIKSFDCSHFCRWCVFIGHEYIFCEFGEFRMLCVCHMHNQSSFL